jgi:HSP20 family protein
MAIIRRNDPERSLARARRWDPFEMMQELMGADPFRELSRGIVGESTGFLPSFEVKETKDSFIFKADLPGIKEDDLEISLSGNMLTISGQRQEEKKDEGDRYYAYERSYGSFTRSFTLPDGADPEHVQAELKDGVLTLVVPKKPEVQPKRIAVKGAGAGSTGEKKAKA